MPIISSFTLEYDCRRKTLPQRLQFPAFFWCCELHFSEAYGRITVVGGADRRIRIMVMTSKMVGMGSPAHLPAKKFCKAQASSNTSRVVCSTWQFNCSNFKHQKLNCLALSQKYSFYICTRRRNHKPASFSAFVCRSSLASPQTNQVCVVLFLSWCLGVQVI